MTGLGDRLELGVEWKLWVFCRHTGAMILGLGASRSHRESKSALRKKVMLMTGLSVLCCDAGE